MWLQKCLAWNSKINHTILDSKCFKHGVSYKEIVQDVTCCKMHFNILLFFWSSNIYIHSFFLIFSYHCLNRPYITNGNHQTFFPIYGDGWASHKSDNSLPEIINNVSTYHRSILPNLQIVTQWQFTDFWYKIQQYLNSCKVITLKAGDSRNPLTGQGLYLHHAPVGSDWLHTGFALLWQHEPCPQMHYGKK